MSEQPDMASVHELLAKLNADIMEDERLTVEKIRQLSSYHPESADDADEQDRQIKLLWREHAERIEPILQHRESLIQAIVRVEAMKPVSVVFPAPPAKG